MGEHPSPLALLESEKEPVTRKALMLSVGTSHCVNEIEYKIRIVTADGHPSNQVAEDGMVAERTGWLRIFTWCALHLIAIVFRTNIFSVGRFVVRGCLYSAHSVRLWEIMSMYRSCLWQKIFETLDVRDGAPSPSSHM